MVKLYKIKFIKDTELKKEGDIAHASKKSAEDYVNNGYAEYITDTIIPKQLQDKKNRFILLKVKDKKPTEKNWQEENNYSFDDPKLNKHKGNIGYICNNPIVIDADSKEINEKCKLMPNTFKVKTGNPEPYKFHYYYELDEDTKPIRLSKEKQGDLGDIRSTGQYVVIPGSTHPSGNKYKTTDDIPIAKISLKYLLSIFQEYINPEDVKAGTAPKDKKDYPTDTTRRESPYIKKCLVPDYCTDNKIKRDTSKNWMLFPYMVDVYNARNVSEEIYKKLAETQEHDYSAVKGWIKSAKEGTLAKSSCKKMRDYLTRFHPEIADDICKDCSLFEKIKEQQEKEKEEELKQKLLEEHKQKISEDSDIKDLLKNPNLLELFDGEFDKKIVKEHDTRKTIFMINNMCNVENLNKATDNLMLNAPSGVGKDYVTESIFEIFPEEEKEELVRTTPKLLAYTRNRLENPKATWKKVRLRLEDTGNDVLNDNTFKVMSSAHPNKINKAKSVQNNKEYKVEIDGKPTITLTMATANPKEEMLRRYPICDLDESIDQTKEILKRQSEFAISGKTSDYDEKFTDALRLLKRVKVKVPYARELVKIFNPENVIVRTHFPRFMDYIKSSCSFHQYQREQDNDGYYIAQKEDYNIARMMLIKTTSNILMIPLTQLQQKIMAVFEENDLQRQSVDDLQDYDGIKKLNIDVEWLRRKLNWLASKGFLIRDKEKRYNEAGKVIPKPVYIYSHNKMQRLEIPEWNNISSFSTNYKNSTNSRITSNTKEKDRVFEHFEVNLHEKCEKITNSDDMNSYDQAKMEGRIPIKD